MGGGVSRGARGERMARQIDALRDISRVEQKLASARAKRMGGMVTEVSPPTGGKSVKVQFQVREVAPGIRFVTETHSVEQYRSQFDHLPTEKLRQFRSGYDQAVKDRSQYFSDRISLQGRLTSAESSLNSARDDHDRNAADMSRAHGEGYISRDLSERYHAGRDRLDVAQREYEHIAREYQDFEKSYPHDYSDTSRLAEFSEKCKAADQVLRGRAAKKGHETRRKNREAREKKIAEVSATIPIRKRKNAAKPKSKSRKPKGEKK